LRILQIGFKNDLGGNVLYNKIMTRTIRVIFDLKKFLGVALGMEFKLWLVFQTEVNAKSLDASDQGCEPF